MTTLKKTKEFGSCLRCSRRFVIYRSKQKFCGVACRVAHHREVKRAELAAKLERLEIFEVLHKQSPNYVLLDETGTVTKEQWDAMHRWREETKIKEKGGP